MILCQKRRALSVRLKVNAVTFFLAIIERRLKSKAYGPIVSPGTIVSCSFWRYSNTPEQRLVVEVILLCHFEPVDTKACHFFGW